MFATLMAWVRSVGITIRGAFQKVTKGLVTLVLGLAVAIGGLFGMHASAPKSTPPSVQTPALPSMPSVLGPTSTSPTPAPQSGRVVQATPIPTAPTSGAEPAWKTLGKKDSAQAQKGPQSKPKKAKKRKAVKAGISDWTSPGTWTYPWSFQWPTALKPKCSCAEDLFRGANGTT